MRNEQRKSQKGVAMLELALLLPILITVFLSFVQIIIFLHSSTVTQYAASVAARAYQVYGSRTLESIDYRHVRGAPYTNKGQAIAEAAAEKVIFESLMWEQSKISLNSGVGSANAGISLDRVYKDGNDLGVDGGGTSGTDGVVRVNLITNRPEFEQGVQVTYCMPIVFPGLDALFSTVKERWPCHVQTLGSRYSGVAIVREAYFGREPS